MLVLLALFVLLVLLLFVVVVVVVVVGVGVVVVVVLLMFVVERGKFKLMNKKLTVKPTKQKEYLQKNLEAEMHVS